MVDRMKFYIHNNKTNIKEYSHRLIKKVMGPYMVDDPHDADLVMVSICDIEEIGDIKKARSYGKPIITGGMISEFPVVNELSDYVYHGEIYGLKKNLDAGISLDDMPAITTKTKRKLIIDDSIIWHSNPIIKVGNRACYYYVSKGCPLKCKYCLIGNSRTYQACPEKIYDKALKIAGKNLMPIAAYNPYGVPDQANIGETLMKKYIKGIGGTKAKMIRTGFEFVTPELSENMAKGVTIDHLNAAIDRASIENTKLIIYMIAGFERQDVLEDFFSKIRIDYKTTPAINFVFTYIDPQPMTPMYDFNLRYKITNINTEKLYMIASQINKRVRILPFANPIKSTLRTLLGRCENQDQYNLINENKNKDFLSLIDIIEKKYPDMIGSAGLDDIMMRPRERIIPSYWN